MNKLYEKNGYLLSTQETILSETLNHYKTLYSKQQVEEILETLAIKKSFQTLKNNK